MKRSTAAFFCLCSFTAGSVYATTVLHLLRSAQW